MLGGTPLLCCAPEKSRSLNLAMQNPRTGKNSWALELSRFDGLAPHSPYAAPGLKYNGFKTIFQSVFACKQSTNSGADDCNLPLHFWSRREDGEARKR